MQSHYCVCDNNARFCMSFDICNSGEKEVACVETVSRIMFKALPMLGRVVLRGRVYRYS